MPLARYNGAVKNEKQWTLGFIVLAFVVLSILIWNLVNYFDMAGYIQELRQFHLSDESALAYFGQGAVTVLAILVQSVIVLYLIERYRNLRK